MEEVKQMTDQELAKALKDLHRRVEQRQGGYTKRDLYKYEAVKQEAHEREFDITSKLIVKNRETGEVIV